MRSALVVVSIGALALLAGTGSSAASLLFNGGFELYVEGGPEALALTPLGGEGLGVGHQALGCTRTGALALGTTCDGEPADRVAEAGALAADPQGEVAAWTAPGVQEGDVAQLAPARFNTWHAAGWNVEPAGAVAFGDVDADGDREAMVTREGALLYQGMAATSTHSALPMGLVRLVHFTLDAAPPAGALKLALDSFPVESAADYPQAWYNYILVIPAGSWTLEDGDVHADPLAGTLTNPRAGSYPAEVDSHPMAQEWADADEDERRAILMELRPIQVTFDGLAAGSVLDQVELQIGA